MKLSVQASLSFWVGIAASWWSVEADLSAEVTATLGTTTTTTTTTTIPLIPHHVQRQRRLMENGDKMSADRINEYDMEENVDYDTPRRRRRDLQAADALQVDALYQGYGTHYIDLWCGSPPQRQTVIVDTGSGVTAFPCTGCRNCGAAPEHHLDKLFTPGDSSTFNKLTCSECLRGHCPSNSGSSGGECTIRMSYQEGSSWTAYEARDTCYVGGPHHIPLTHTDSIALGMTQKVDDLDPNHADTLAFDLIFGCQTHLTGLFKTQLADGIMGMDDGKEAFWSQLFRSGHLGKKKQFALCFARQPTAEREGTEAGALTLGGTDPRWHTSQMVWSSDGGSGGGFFHVKIRNAYLQSGTSGTVNRINIESSSLNSGGVIVDSGTTDTYFTRHLAAPFGDLFKKLTGKAFSHAPVDLSEEELNALPTIIFQLYGDKSLNGELLKQDATGLAADLDPDHPTDMLLVIPPSHYMEYDHKTKRYIARFYLTEAMGSVLGGNAMMGHDVLFDVDNHRIGWAESDCDYTKLLTENGYPSVLSDEYGASGAVDVVDDTESELETVEDEMNDEVEEDEEEEVEEEDDEAVDDEDAGKMDDEEDDLDDVGVDVEVKKVLEEETDDAVENDDAVGDDGVGDDFISDDDGDDQGFNDDDETMTPHDTDDNVDGDDEQDVSHQDGPGDLIKKKGKEGDEHEQSSPKDDITKTLSDVADACSSLLCRGSALGAILTALICGMCLGRCCLGRTSSKSNHKRSEVEMKNGNFSSYKDDPESAEYGDFDDFDDEDDDDQEMGS